MTLFYTHIESPVGPLLAAGTERALHLLSFAGERTATPQADWQACAVPFAELRRQLTAYFAGELREFDIAVELCGTAFQNEVWRQLATIPFGQTRSYGQIADAIGRPKASRAVGAANGDNPLPIILPCHRVIGADGSLTGFGGGLPIKEFLLRLEGAMPGNDGQLDMFDP